MSEPYLDVLGGRARYAVMLGHVLDQLRLLPDGCVQVACFSPPYFGLRDYKTEPAVWGGALDCAHAWQTTIRPIATGGSDTTSAKQQSNTGSQMSRTPWQHASCARCGAWRGELGSEAHPDFFVEHIVEIMAEVWRVLRLDGTVWLNINDSYAGSGKGPTGSTGIGDSATRQGFGRLGVSNVSQSITRKFTPGNPDKNHGASNRDGVGAVDGVRAKSLMLIPDRLRLALAEAGWIMRSVIIWDKLAPMPESVLDRPTSAYEPVILLSKAERYYYDREALRENDTGRRGSFVGRQGGARDTPLTGGYGSDDSNGRNGRNVWHLGPDPSDYDYCLNCDRLYRGSQRSSIKRYPACSIATRQEILVPSCAGCGSSDSWVDHFAAFPAEIPRRAIMAGSSDKGCCSACGAPWRRVTERSSTVGQSRGATPSSGRSGDRAQQAGITSTTITVDWQPSCACGADLVPCLALDPFSGTGTTVIEADRLGRRGIGIELNPSYAKLATARLSNDAPLFGNVAL